jgi:hypothetical protein
MLQKDIEAVYEELATGIDRVGEPDANIFLAQVCLLLARELGDRDRALELIRQALRLHKGGQTGSATPER